MRSFKNVLITFLAITGAVALATGLLDVRFGSSNFWEFHGILFLGFIAFFPRLTLLLSGVATGGVLWWLSWIFAPRLLVAVLATVEYWNHNPFLVLAAWLVALSGEPSEKYMIVRRSTPRREPREV